MNKWKKQALRGVAAIVALAPLAASAQCMMDMAGQSGPMPMMGTQQGGGQTMPPAPQGMPMRGADAAGMPMHDMSSMRAN